MQETVRVGPAATISPFIGKLFPDVQLNFPVQLCRELLGKRLNLVVDLDACIAAEHRIGRNSLFNSLLPGNLPHPAISPASAGLPSEILSLRRRP